MANTLIDNPLFQLWIFYTSVLGLKMLAMSVLTGLQRLIHKVYINPEDCVVRKVKVRVDDNVERVRRAHLNDIENIIVFMIVSLGYILSNPSLGVATLLFRVVTACRFLHTFVYAIVVIPPPARGIGFAVPFFITTYMAAQTALTFSSSM